jgi:hypothetical protein
MCYLIEPAIINEYDRSIRFINRKCGQEFISKTEEEFRNLRNEFIYHFIQFKEEGKLAVSDFVEICERKQEIYKNTKPGEVERVFIDREYEKALNNLRAFF